MKTFNVLLQVPQSELATVLQALDGTVMLVKIEEAEKLKIREQRYANGKKNKGIKGERLVLDLVTKSKVPVKLADIGEAMRKRGFADSSLSPIVSRLVAKGEIKRLDNNMIGVGK